jgi:hypothetical protein
MLVDMNLVAWLRRWYTRHARASQAWVFEYDRKSTRCGNDEEEGDGRPQALCRGHRLCAESPPPWPPEALPVSGRRSWQGEEGTEI